MKKKSFKQSISFIKKNFIQLSVPDDNEVGYHKNETTSRRRGTYPVDDKHCYTSTPKYKICELIDGKVKPKAGLKYDPDTFKIKDVKNDNTEISSDERKKLFLVKVVHNSLKTDKQFKRRLVTFLEVPEGYEYLYERCHVEYIGK